jgi:hypothetical protein
MKRMIERRKDRAEAGGAARRREKREDRRESI